MSFSPSLPGDDRLSPDDLARVIAACDRFEADRNAGGPRRIEDELAGAADDPIHARLFRELVALELELTERDGRSSDPNALLGASHRRSGIKSSDVPSCKRQSTHRHRFSR